MQWGNLNLDEYQDYECAPFINPKIWENKERKYATCYTTNQLHNLINAYNNDNSNDPININTNDKYELWRALRSKLTNLCSNDVCWLNLPFVNTYLHPNEIEKMQLQFRPIMPIEKDGNTFEVWLSNLDIDNVMRQYEILFPKFKFIGCFPCDWAKYSNMYTLNSEFIHKLLKSGFDQLAIIFNTGTLKSGGQHWVCVFMDFKNDNNKFSIEYFDSVGNQCQKDIKLLLNNTQELINNFCSRKKNKKPFYCTKNIIRKPQNKSQYHQKRGGECGVYCLYFIVRRLLGDTYEDINKFDIPDITMSLLRIILFRHPKYDNKNYKYNYDKLKDNYKNQIKNIDFAKRGFR